MATRLLFIATIRASFVNPLRSLRSTHYYYVRPELSALGNIRTLHKKVLDTETNWNAQRNDNKYNIEESKDFSIAAEIAKHSATNREPATPLETQKSEMFYQTTRMESAESSAATDNADVFGTMPQTEQEDEGDIAEEEYISNPPTKSQRLDPIQYVRMIKGYLKAKQLQDAIDVVEIRMKRDRVRPESYTYNLLISGCGKAGYTKKAFNLFTKMRQRGLQVTGGTYTSLLNACANAPSADDGLKRANHVREIMLEKGVEPNVKNYNAMIKAYGRWGDVKTAYQLADEMLEKKLEFTAETFNFLLQACASDKKFGFSHCLLTWHKMLKSGFKPDYYTFKTMLRCVRDCDFGDLDTMQNVLKEILEHQDMQLSIGEREEERSRNTLLLTTTEDVIPPETNTELKKMTPAMGVSTNPFNVSKTEKATRSPDRKLTNPFKSLDEMEETSVSVAQPPNPILVPEKSNETVFEIPNLLSTRPHLGSMMSISEVRCCHERFLLVGGITGFLDLMKQNNITPDIQMFTMLLEVIPPTNAAEKQVLSLIRRIGLKADIDFFNVLIKKRSMRFDYVGAKEVLSMVRTAGLHPDIVTYGVLALGCTSQEEAREFLQEMRAAGVRMNIQILGAMLRQGCANRSFPYVCEIIQISLDEHIKPNDIFLRHLNNFYIQCARAIDSRHPSTKTKNFKKQHTRFCDKLRLYYEENGIAGLKLNDAIKVIKERPYQQYKEEKVVGLEPEKNEVLSKKQKLRKYIKKIKIENLKGDETEDKPTQPKALSAST